METVRSRFLKIMNGELPEDRLPIIEWAPWWDKTINRWHSEGLAKDADLFDYFGLDRQTQMWCPTSGEPLVAKYKGNEGEYYIKNEADYDEVRKELDKKELLVDPSWSGIKELQDKGGIITWLTLTGFFWGPRTLFGIEPHLYAFYDYPKLMKRIIDDMVEEHLRCIDHMCKFIVPDFMTFAEDMSYNHGPMVSKDVFYEFLAPAYRRVIPKLKEYGIIPIIDSDGDITAMVPWFMDVGIEGVLPLERQAGVDVNALQEDYPEWKMIGGYDKMVMNQGEAAIREEFERLLPAMKRGRFIPSVDHQTPPGVSMEQYKVYMKIFKEYAIKACE